VSRLTCFLPFTICPGAYKSFPEDAEDTVAEDAEDTTGTVAYKSNPEDAEDIVVGDTAAEDAEDTVAEDSTEDIVAGDASIDADSTAENAVDDVVAMVIASSVVASVAAFGRLMAPSISIANFEPNGSAQFVSDSESFRLTMSSNGVLRSSIRSPESSHII